MMRHEKKISVSEGKKKVPDTIQCYKHTNYGVIFLDQMARLYTEMYHLVDGHYMCFTILLIYLE